MGRPQPFHVEHFVPILKSQPEIYRTEFERSLWKKIQPRLARVDLNYVRVPVDNNAFILFTPQPLSAPDGQVQSSLCEDVADSFESTLNRMPESNANVTSSRPWSVQVALR